METKKPIYNQALQFSRGIHAAYPGKFLAYNLSPSFNWDAAGMSDDEIKNFISELGKLGFVWQFITLGGVSFIIFCFFNLLICLVPFQRFDF